MTVRKPATNTLVAKLKKTAKESVSDQLTYTDALNQQAVLVGYIDWRELAMANGARNAEEGSEFMLDPVLREGFDDTPNEERTTAELDKFWCKPFILSRDDGKFTVRCLDGGAWDRSTNYGVASTLEEAKDIAKTKLRNWMEITARPVACYRGGLDGLVDLMVMNQRPDEEPRIVASGLNTQNAAAEIERYMEMLGLKE
ncbi:hypothetical protein MCEMSHM24_02485 [Comamonadaceae bacterium]